MQLTCYDWHGPAVPWHQQHIIARMKANGFWAVTAQRTGRYRFTLRERPRVANHPLVPGAARLKVGDQVLSKPIPRGAIGVSFDVDLKAGGTKLQTWLAEGGGGVRGAYYVEVNYLGPAKVEPQKPQQPAPEPSPRKPRPPGAYD